MKTIVAIFSIIIAAGITLVWIKELIAPHMKQNLLKRREGEHLVWPHITIEAFTAALMFFSGIGSLLDIQWAALINCFSLGAVFYASFNSLSWTLADKSRWLYTIYMLIGVFGSVALLVLIMKGIVN